jgi:hypothetical protein
MVLPSRRHQASAIKAGLTPCRDATARSAAERSNRPPRPSGEHAITGMLRTAPGQQIKFNTALAQMVQHLIGRSVFSAG